MRDQVRDSLNLAFDVEEQRVKQIVRPVHVYYPLINPVLEYFP